MKNNKLYVVLGVVLGILVLVGAAYLGRSINNRENKAKVSLAVTGSQSDYSLNGNTCHDRSNYFIVTRKDASGNAGEDILVKYKVKEDTKIECKYSKSSNDYELPNTTSEGQILAQYFSNADNNLLIVDEGTGTSRDFKIYNLDKREKVFTDTYSSGLFDLKNGILTYWHKTNDVPNKENCTKVDEYNAMGGSKIEAKTTLNLLSLSKKYNEFRCSYAE